MAEIEISVFEQGCLSRPVGDRQTRAGRVAALKAARNGAGCTIRWRFTSQRARVKPANLSPANHPQQDCVLGVLPAWVDLVLLA